MTYEKLLSRVVEKYLTSGDFNGYRATQDLDRKLINQLITDRKLELHCPDRHPNPYIRAFPAEPISIQLSKLHSTDACLYPTPDYLKRVVEVDAKKPFTTMLAQGSAQLEFKSFDLSILEFYRNEPRYYYECNDISGSIIVKSKGSTLQESDQILLKQFGFSYNHESHRAVAVLLRYLNGLSSRHQRYWEARMLNDEFSLHPGYLSVVAGEFDTQQSIYDALLAEQQHVNIMANQLGMEPLFRHTERPKEFAILIRPTRKEFDDFVLVLDKLLSDNLNRNFFKKDLQVKETVIAQDGKNVTKPIPTIQLLEQWLREVERREKDEMLKILRRIRRLRNRSAHTLRKADEFNQEFLEKQSTLIQDAYFAVRIIRIIFHEDLRIEHSIPDWITEGRHWIK